jgi:UV DNA damage endonuclease
MPKTRAGASKDAPVFFARSPGPRWGLCCQFIDSPIRFRQATHRYCSTLSRSESRDYLSEIVLANAQSLLDAIEHCAQLEIGAFRITSQFMPLATHPESGYQPEDLPRWDFIKQKMDDAARASKRNDVRLSFHPDQFVVLNSESERVVTASIVEMEHQARVARMLGAQALTLHGGGKAGGSSTALDRLAKGIDRLSVDARELLALENDDRSFSPAELLPFCERSGVPFVYDVHHHRCNSDEMSVAESTHRGIATWGDREPWMHISSPRDGWDVANPRLHADFIDPDDVPKEWIGKRITVDVEAKQKERAVIAISEAMGTAQRTEVRKSRTI